MKHSHLPFERAGIRLRLLEERDLPLTLAWRNRDGVRQKFVFSAEVNWHDHLSWFSRYQQKSDDLVFLVEDNLSSAPIGQVAIYSIDQTAGRAEVGRFVVSPEYAGQGRMKRAIEALLEFAQIHLSLKGVYLEVLEGNDRAYHLYCCLGFSETARREGRIVMELNFNADAKHSETPTH